MVEGVKATGSAVVQYHWPKAGSEEDVLRLSYAVVASEDESLATEAAKATEEISEKITTNQAMIGETEQAISRINEIISRVRETSTTIAPWRRGGGLAG